MAAGGAKGVSHRPGRAANRGGDLTQRLLAFSRHQPSQPKAIDAGHLVSNMVEMFRRSLGEVQPGARPNAVSQGRMDHCAAHGSPR